MKLFPRPLLCIALALSCIANASAQSGAGSSAAPPESMIDAATLDAMCNTDGAMTYKFGQVGVVPGGRNMTLITKPLALPAGFATFTHARAASTAWSGKFMEITYSVSMKNADSADAIIAQFSALADASGWQWYDGSFDETPLYLAAYAESDSFFKPLGYGPDAPMLMLNIAHVLGELQLTCGRSDLLKVHAGEAFGKLPPGTPRPTVPNIAIPPLRDPALCNDPATLAAIDDFIAGRSSDTIMVTMIERTTYRDRLTSWMLWKIEESGKLSSAELLKLAFAGVASGSPKGDIFAGLKMIETMFPIIEKLSLAEKAGDRPKICLALTEFHQWMTEVDAITLAQTRSTQASLVAKAKQLNIDLN